ncbi:MAG: hypothetical protein D6767_09360 [Candidatus Hydrogenedentota bacterium]|nr:MAG: hypothetical protein D6767_09360 [Candidatus Hydrogenedentota bacterium]
MKKTICMIVLCVFRLSASYLETGYSFSANQNSYGEIQSEGLWQFSWLSVRFWQNHKSWRELASSGRVSFLPGFLLTENIRLYGGITYRYLKASEQSWKKPQALAGIQFQKNIADAKFEVFVATDFTQYQKADLLFPLFQSIALKANYEKDMFYGEVFNLGAQLLYGKASYAVGYEADKSAPYAEISVLAKKLTFRFKLRFPSEKAYGIRSYASICFSYGTPKTNSLFKTAKRNLPSFTYKQNKKLATRTDKRSPKTKLYKKISFHKLVKLGLSPQQAYLVQSRKSSCGLPKQKQKWLARYGILCKS